MNTVNLTIKPQHQDLRLIERHNDGGVLLTTSNERIAPVVLCPDLVIDFNSMLSFPAGHETKLGFDSLVSATRYAAGIRIEVAPDLEIPMNYLFLYDEEIRQLAA